MLINANVALVSAKVILVPYTAAHVQTYHEWMRDEALREATASEALSLEDEYAMQRSWRQDHDKLTFIACVRHSEHAFSGSTTLKAGQLDYAASMIGDINLFLCTDEEDEQLVLGEIELMIADKSFRRQGYGKATLLAFLHYIRQHEQQIMHEYNAAKVHVGRPVTTTLAYLRVKINQDNKPSIALFQSSGFELVSPQANYFGELELRSTMHNPLPAAMTPQKFRYDETAAV